MKKKNDSWGYAFWLFIVTLISLIFAVVYGALLVRATHASPPEPTLKELVDMEPHPSLGGVFHYKNGEKFSHAKKGAIRYTDSEPGYKVFVDLQEIWFVTDNGVLYVFWLEPTFYLNPKNDKFESTIEKSWPPCGCQ